MRQSKFSDEQKKRIIAERNSKGLTISEICSQYNISTNTFYKWKVDLNENKKAVSNNASIENEVLRKLYINLSEHNYQLAKFLDK